MVEYGWFFLCKIFRTTMLEPIQQASQTDYFNVFEFHTKK